MNVEIWIHLWMFELARFNALHENKAISIHNKMRYRTSNRALHFANCSVA
jgi:hypothetical protein